MLDLSLICDPTDDRRPAIYLEASDAGAFFRFIDLYPRMATGQMSLVLDMPPDDASREGFLIVRDFVVHREHIAEPSIDPLQPNPIPDLQNGVAFSQLLVEFSLSGRTLAISQGIASGPLVNATLKGRIDFAGNDVEARGIVLPGSGGRDQGVLLPPFDGVNPALGFAYDFIGPLQAPIVRTRPTSAIPPSLLHPLFEFPAVRE
jgi:hypothetical protein